MQAEKRMIEAEENKEYLPIDGLADFKKATLQLLLGSSHPAIKEVSCNDVVHACMHTSPYTRHQTLLQSNNDLSSVNHQSAEQHHLIGL